MGFISQKDRLADLQDQIDTATAQLQSLDENDKEYEVRKMMLEHGLETLGEQCEAALRDEHGSQREETSGEHDQPSLSIIGNQRPQTSDGLIGIPNSGFVHYMGSTPGNVGGHFASDSVITAQREPPPWSFGNIQTSAIPMESAAFPPIEDGPPSGSGSASSPDAAFVRPQKRQRESISIPNDLSGHPSKSMRTTPSPAMTATTTPTSLSSFELPEDPELLALLGGNPAQDLRDMKEEQREQERSLEAKRQQERADEEFARQLMEQDTDISSFENSSRPGSSAFPRNNSQTVLDNQGRFRRPTPYPLSSPASSVKIEDPFSMPSLPMEENSYRTSHAPVKNEGSYRSSYNNIPSSEFIDLENEDFLSEHLNGVAGHPSSDLVEIDPSAFGDKNRGDQNRVSAFESYDPHGSSGLSGASNWDLSGGCLGQSLVNTASNLFNGAYSMLDQQIGNYGSAPVGFGGISVYGPNGRGSSTDIIDLESDDTFPYLPEDIFSRHGINAHDPANSDLVASYRDRIDYVANDPTRTSSEIKSLLENIRPDEDLPPENREGTPEAMTYPLMEHQKLGLAWMKSMEEGSNKGGILADDMGLGKTIQALALMVANKSTERACKTTLIVCPVALLKQWDREIQDKLKQGHQLKVYTLHSEKRHVKWAKLRTYDVVLTTFGTLGTEVKRMEQIAMNKRVNPNWTPSGKNDYLPLLGDECQWYRVIIDEAQCIKNKNTKAAVGASLLQAKTRFCMTGTPMMNNVTELFSLIHFLRIKPYCEADRFSRDFTRPLMKSHNEAARTKAMRQLQALLKAILLRRTKKSQIDGKPILNLPERTTEASQAEFSQDEAELYSALENRSQLQFNKFLRAGTVGRNYSNILVLLLRLRQACCHPHLIKDFGQTSSATELTPEEMRKLAKELAPEVVTRIKAQSESNDDAALECPICMDFTENATIFIPCGHNACSECFARITDPSQAIADGNAEGRAEAKCPNCRGKISPSKAIDHKLFKQIYMPQLLSNEDSVDDPEADIETTDDSDNEDTTDDDEDSEEEVDSEGNLKNFIVNDDEDDVGDNASATEDDDDDDLGVGSSTLEKSSKKKNKKRSKGKGKAREAKAPRKTLAELKKEGMRNVKARRKYLKRLHKDWIPSAKTEKAMEIMRNIQERKDPITKQCEKTIVFSQFTSLLDLLEVPMSAENWNYSRYDGSMSAGARNDAVLSFMQKRDCKIMLVSLKAGNSGLNLTVASQVILLDPFWNPFVEEQAIDRAHRIGQQRPVQVHRILIPNTVEDRILALQEKKREIIEGALDEKASQSIGRLGTRELGFLFDVPT